MATIENPPFIAYDLRYIYNIFLIVPKNDSIWNRI